MTRLAYITTAPLPSPKASSVQVMQMCAAFAEAGAEVTLYAQQGDEALESGELQARYGVADNFDIVQLPKPGGPRPGDRLQWRFARAASRGGPWVAYGRGSDLSAPLVGLSGGAVAAGIEVHGRPQTTRLRWQLRALARSRRTRLVALSDVLRQIYIDEVGIAPERIFVAPDGVDVNRFTPMMTTNEARTVLGLDASRRLVVYVGGLYRGRGLAALFAAMAGLDADLAVVGGRDADEVAQWRARLGDYGLNAARVRFAGYMAPAAVPAWLFAADVLVMPYSRQTITPSGEDTTAWMSPLKMFEYLAAGGAIVASDLPALTAVLTHEQNALLCPPDDANGLREAIGRLLSDDALNKRLRQAARVTASRFSWKARAERILTELRGAQT